MSETTTHENSELNSTRQDILDQLLKPEVQESLTKLVDQLPQLTEIVGLLTKSFDFAQNVATDEILKNDTVGAITEMVAPITKTVKSVAATAIEAKEQAAESTEVIGLFGVLRLMKDPQTQKLLRFLNAFLQISGQKENK